MTALRFIVSLTLALLAGEAAAIAVTHVFPVGAAAFIVVHAAVFAAIALPVGYFLAVRPLHRRLAEFSIKQQDHLSVLDDLRQRIAERDAEVAATQHTLEDTNSQLDAALNNMRQGLCMYDADTRLVLCNDSYLGMYGLSAEAARPGSLYRQVLEELKKADNFHQNPDQFIAKIKSAIAKGESLEVFAKLRHKIIRIVTQPLANGGWVATHEDVTAQRNAESEFWSRMPTISATCCSTKPASNSSACRRKPLSATLPMSSFRKKLLTPFWRAISTCSRKAVRTTTAIAQCTSPSTDCVRSRPSGW